MSSEIYVAELPRSSCLPELHHFQSTRPCLLLDPRGIWVNGSNNRQAFFSFVVIQELPWGFRTPEHENTQENG